MWATLWTLRIVWVVWMCGLMLVWPVWGNVGTLGFGKQ